jgi:hypothetical protein
VSLWEAGFFVSFEAGVAEVEIHCGVGFRGDLAVGVVYQVVGDRGDAGGFVEVGHVADCAEVIGQRSADVGDFGGQYLVCVCPCPSNTRDVTIASAGRGAEVVG